MSYNSLNPHIAMTDSQIPHTTKKTARHNPLIQTLRTAGWQVNPLITITTGVRGAIHEQSIKDLEKLKTPKSEIQTLMKHLHQIAIKYLTYLILNKRKLDNNNLPLIPLRDHVYCFLF